MTPTRVVLVGVPALLAGILRQSFEDRGIVPSGELAAETDLESTLPPLAPDVVVAAGPLSEDPGLDRIIRAVPTATVLGVRDSGRSVVLWELWPRRSELGEISPSDLTAASGALRTPWASR